MDTSVNICSLKLQNSPVFRLLLVMKHNNSSSTLEKVFDNVQNFHSRSRGSVLRFSKTCQGGSLGPYAMTFASLESSTDSFKYFFYEF